jgi:hypothetical protein
MIKLRLSLQELLFGGLVFALAEGEFAVRGVELCLTGFQFVLPVQQLLLECCKFLFLAVKRHLSLHELLFGGLVFALAEGEFAERGVELCPVGFQFVLPVRQLLLECRKFLFTLIKLRLSLQEPQFGGFVFALAEGEFAECGVELCPAGFQFVLPMRHLLLECCEFLFAAVKLALSLQELLFGGFVFALAEGEFADRGVK